MVTKEEFRLTVENRQLKKKLKQALVENEKLERDYKDLAEFAQHWPGPQERKPGVVLKC